MRFSLLFLLFGTSLLSADAEDTCHHTSERLQCVQYVKNYDADTITFQIPGVHPLIGDKIPVRVLGIDTPEIRTRNRCEKEKGYQAKKYVEGLLKKAKRIDLVKIKRGKYFRIVAEVIIDGQPLSELLLSQNYAYRYDGGTKPKNMNWCSRQPASSK